MAARNADRNGTDPEKLLRLADRADATGDDTVAALIAYAALTGNDHAAATVENAFATAAARHADYPFDVSAYPLATTPGPAELHLGTVLETARPFTVPEASLTQHVLETGITGAGKTTFIYTLLDELSVPYWVFDLKTDYRHRIRTDDVVVLPWEELRVNPLQPPPGVSRQRWAQHVTAILGDAYDLLSGSQHYLTPHLLALYEESDCSSPALPDLRDYIQDEGETGRSQSTYKDRVWSRLRAICDGTDPVFRCQAGYDLTALLQRNVVFEFDGLASDHQDFLMELLVTWVYVYRDAQQHRGGGLRHVFVMDEGKRAFSVYKERQDAKGLPTIDGVMARLREFGEGVIVGDQEPAKLTQSLKANTGTKVLFPIGEDRQFQEMAASMRLTDLQQRYASELATGQAVVQVGTSEPVPVQFRYQDLAKDVDDAELQERMQATWQQLQQQVDSQNTREVETGESRARDADSAAQPAQRVSLSEDAELLVKDIADAPFKQLTDRYELFSNPKQGIAAKTELVEKGLAREKYIRQSYGRFKVLELTELGRRWLAAHEMPVERQGRGGVVHRYWQHQIKAAVEALGWTATLEKEDADVFAERDGQTVAIEVAMENRDREVEHVRDRLAADVDRVVVAARTKAVMHRLQEALEEADLFDDRVAVTVVQEFDAEETAVL